MSDTTEQTAASPETEARAQERAAVSNDVAELTVKIDSRSVEVTLDEELYPRDAIYGAAYLFVDRCFLFLSRPADRMVTVRLKAKDAEVTEAALEALAGDFANELLNQVVRARVGTATAQLREYYMARAFFGTEGQATIDALLEELDAEELEEEPLEIAVPWEKSGD